MKFLAIAFLLVQTVHGLTMTRVDCADGINDARAKHAKQAQWADVNKLSYSINLEKTLWEFLDRTDGCPQGNIGGPYEVVLKTLSYHDRTENGLEYLRSRGPYGMRTSTMVACTLTTCLKDGEQILSIITDNVQYPPIPPPQGPPGSKCYLSGRLANSEGLCVLKSNKKKFVRKGVLQQVGDAMDHTFGWG
ncbi:hypothetical protein CRE_29273 [Caenorhabditis remanei]|uniref:SCP domain-containing protein n=2 Tax=Caenorhabditis remanei TaxID=31234 RepID=E3NQH5_CAERE|nr:hypothetical protein CRE_29273 [Caenorhabditis remanei]